MDYWFQTLFDLMQGESQSRLQLTTFTIFQQSATTTTPHHTWSSDCSLVGNQSLDLQPDVKQLTRCSEIQLNFTWRSYLSKSKVINNLFKFYFIHSFKIRWNISFILIVNKNIQICCMALFQLIFCVIFLYCIYSVCSISMSAFVTVS